MKPARWLLALALLCCACERKQARPPDDSAARAAEVEARARKEAEERAAAARAEEARAREEKAAALKRAIGWVLVEKRFQPKDMQGGRYEDLFVIRAEYKNESGKDLRSFSGTLLLKDEHGGTLMTSKVNIAEPLKSGDKGTFRAQKVFDSFSDVDVRLRDGQMAGVRVEWLPGQVVFEDGTTR